jgi:hypothetical protein
MKLGKKCCFSAKQQIPWEMLTFLDDLGKSHGRLQ